MHRLREDNVQKIFGRDRPSGDKMKARTRHVQPDDTLTANRRFTPNLATPVNPRPLKTYWKGFSKILRLGVSCPKTSKLKKLPYSYQPTANRTHCTKILFTARIVQAPGSLLVNSGQVFIARQHCTLTRDIDIAILSVCLSVRSSVRGGV